MKKLLLLLFLLPTLAFGQAHFIATPQVSYAGLNSKSVNLSALVGFKTVEGDILEVGYVYKRYLSSDIIHKKDYHGIRLHGQIELWERFGPFIEYDFVHGERYLYELADLVTPDLYNKFYGEATLGFYYNFKDTPVNLSAGFMPYYYDPLKLNVGKTPHKSVNVFLTLSYNFTSN